MFWFVLDLTEAASSSDQYIATNRMSEQWIGKDVGGSGRGLVCALSRDLPGGTEDGTEILSQSSPYPDPDSNLTPPRYNAAALPPES